MNSFEKLINRYIRILEIKGEPNEKYKYDSIDVFQKNWDIDAPDFYKMFLNSFAKRSNLLFQNSWGFINLLAKHLPEKARFLFRNLYDEKIPLQERFLFFQTESKNLLNEVKQLSNKQTLNDQQDERTIAFYLACRYPEKYIFYKNEFYKSYCDEFGLKIEKAGEKFFHLNRIADDIISSNLLNNNKLQNLYRSFYPKPLWNDERLIIQNILFVCSREEVKVTGILDVLNNFDFDDLVDYYDFLDRIIEKFDLKEEDKRLVFNTNEKELIFTVGQRYVWNLRNIKNNNFNYRAISTKQFSPNYEKFDGASIAFLNNVNDFKTIISNSEDIFNAIEIELNSTNKSGYSKNNDSSLEKIAFYKDYRAHVFSQLDKNKKAKTTEVKKIKMENHSLNQILYGPPGTGKTYKLKNEYFSKYTLTENSISPEAYFEDVVSTLTWWQVIALALLEIGTSKVNDILENRWVSKKAVLSESKNVRATIWGTLQMHTIVDSKTVNYTQRQTPFIFDKTEDKKWQLFEIELKEQAPETYDILDSVNHFKPNPNKEIKHYVFTTFHQSFSYEDFIEGIKPVMEEGQENVTYKIENGVFKELCLRAQNDPNNRYAIFIDEINRGNVSQIFGELITLIEQDKRIGAKNEIKVKLPYSKKEFGVPMNVDVIGTMNTADRSVEALDTALRRRFSFVEMMPEYKELYNIQFDDFNLGEVLEIINQRIEALLDRDHTIGHSYFINILPNDTEALKEAFGNKIIPLLQEYFYHDYEKIALILGEEFIVCKEQNDNKVQFAKWSGKNLDQPEITRVFNIRKLDDDFKILSAIKSLLNRE